MTTRVRRHVCGMPLSAVGLAMVAAAAKTLIQLLAYVAFFGWLGVLLRRATSEG